MSTPEPKTHPVICTECSQPMASPVCCTGCGALNPLPPSLFSYFELFGIPAGFDVDPGELRRKYLSLSRSIHPDVAGRDSDRQHRQSLELSSGLNLAFETLRNPVSRAEYLLRLAGGPSAADSKSVPSELLGEVMMLREEIEEACEAEDAATLESMRQSIRSRHDQTLEEIARLCRGSLDDPHVQTQLRQQLNMIKYWNNLLEQIPAEMEA